MRIAWKLPLFILLVLLLAASASCRRSLSDEERGISEIQATHPWELPAGVGDYRSRVLTQQQQEIPPDGQVDIPDASGPAFGDTDTVDVGLLPGSWVMIASAATEKLDLRSNKEYSTLSLQQNGMFRLFIYVDGEIGRTHEGNWAKTAPGVLTLTQMDQSGNGQPVELQTEMFGPDFLFMWSYSDHIGYWYARQVHEEPPQVIGYNRYKTNLGDILLSNVGQQSYYGEMTVPDGSVWQLNGYLVDGVLNMAWVDGQNNASGFAAFIVDGDWDRMRGVYWKNFYKAAPFTDAWLAEADR